MFLLIVLVIKILKWRGLFDDSHQQVFDRLVTDFGLPAIVFALLATAGIKEIFVTEWILPVVVMIAAVLATILVAWAICRALNLTPATTGSIVLLSGFGSTYTIGLPTISKSFGTMGSLTVLGQVISLFGVVLPLFTLGIVLANHFGHKEKHDGIGPIECLKNYLFSPLFIAFVLGLGCSLCFSYFHMPGEAIFSDLCFDFFGVIRNAFHLFIWIAIGLLISPIPLRRFIPLLTLVIFFHMLVLPAFVVTGSAITALPSSQAAVAEILALMPSGAVATVVANRYGCDGKLAAGILISTYLIAFVTLPLLSPLLLTR
jgi:Predicted permeases